MLERKIKNGDIPLDTRSRDYLLAWAGQSEYTGSVLAHPRSVEEVIHYSRGYILYEGNLYQFENRGNRPAFVHDAAGTAGLSRIIFLKDLANPEVLARVQIVNPAAADHFAELPPPPLLDIYWNREVNEDSRNDSSFHAQAGQPIRVKDSAYAQIGERGGMRKVIIDGLDGRGFALVQDLQYPSVHYRIRIADLATHAETEAILHALDTTAFDNHIASKNWEVTRRHDYQLETANSYYLTIDATLDPNLSPQDFAHSLRNHMDMGPVTADRGQPAGSEYDPRVEAEALQRTLRRLRNSPPK